MNKYLLLLVIFFLLSSCATRKQILYFQDIDDNQESELALAFEPIIESNDVLHIAVSSLDQQVVAPFQRNRENAMQNNQNQFLQGYLVNSDGDIQFPVLGPISVLGKTRKEVEAILTKKLTEFVNDVVVDVRIINFKVTVIGGVTSPGVYRIPDERITLIEAIGLAGDLSLDGRRNDIMIIRQEDGKQKVSRVDITDTNFMNSPYFFLKQNDVVYVEPSLRGVKKAGFIPDIPALLSLFTVILSTVIIITR